MKNFKKIINCIKNGGNLPIVENGKIIKETYDNGNLFIDFIIYIGKNLIRLIYFLGSEGQPILIIIGVIGMYFIMSDNEKVGYKLTSTSILSYLVCKLLGGLL